ncbi:MAG: alanine--tRNA ligase [Candidatus Hadarchaeota archaeon]
MKDIYEVELFDSEGFERKECVACGRTFWTLDPDRTTCGDTPCDEYSFIGNPPIDKDYTRSEMEEEFLSFFERNNHEAIPRYPVVAWWRDDIYLTIASIADFQPWVTNGEAPPPANPLVVSQPSIRLNDIDNVGRSGRHFTLFFMGGHHAFNRKDDWIYWNDETVRLCHEFLTGALGIDADEVTYIQDFWEGGGSAGEDFEVNVRGLELATLVFMQYGVDNGARHDLPLKIVDTGYGIDRMAWASQGTPTSYEAVLGPTVSKIRKMAGITPPPENVIEKNSKLAGLMDIESGRDLNALRTKISEETGLSVGELDEMLVPLENVYAVADHLRCLAFMFGDGITPSNEGGGYLSRLVLRRTLRIMRELGLEVGIAELMDSELDRLKPDFPELDRKKDHILEVIDLEENRYEETLEKGKRQVTRLSSKLKERGESRIPEDELIELYDSHGLPPEMVGEVAEREDMKVDVPDDFYMRVAESHSHSEGDQAEEIEIPSGLDLVDLPETEALYYKHPYRRDFEAEVLAKEGNFVVLDRTAFYPEGGGQPADTGLLFIDGEEVSVGDVQKFDGVIVHELESADEADVGDKISGRIDWETRSSYMRHHTATHILLGALERRLGDHVRQHGVQKGKESSRLDVSHFKRITEEELRDVEELANEIVLQNRKINSFWMDRNEAESKYGHSLYQGGVVPGSEIRIVDIEDWNAQACAGTHCTRTGEVGMIKIIGRERIQDGVERLVFASGKPILKEVQRREERVRSAAEKLRSEPSEIDDAVEKLYDMWKTARKEADVLKSRLAAIRAESLERKAEEINGLRLVYEELEDGDSDELIEIGERLTEKNDDLIVILAVANGSGNILAMAGESAVEAGIDCGRIASEAAEVLGGGGGGRPSMAQGGGERAEKLGEAIKIAVETTKEQVSN